MELLKENSLLLLITLAMRADAPFQPILIVIIAIH